MKRLLSVLAFLVPVFSLKAQVKPELQKEPQTKVKPNEVKPVEVILKDANGNPIKSAALKIGAEQTIKVASKTYKEGSKAYNDGSKAYKQPVKSGN